MNVNSISSSSFTGQLAASGSGQARQSPPPPPPGPPPGEGGFVNAIGSALESLGVTDVAATDKESSASALGSFLQELMSSLHEQGEANGAQGEEHGGPGGPGRLAEDLQSLISSLQSDDTESSEASPLETSFSSLLSALGGDSSDSQSRLTTFLQALADKLPQAGSSVNLINTTA